MKRSNCKNSRRGAILLLAAFLMAVMVGMVAFALDMGYIANTRTELQRAADAAAYAGSSMLPDGIKAAEDEALKFLGKNLVGGKTLGKNDVEIEFGQWDPNTRTFVVNNDRPAAVRVTAQVQDQPLFFAKIFGRKDFDTQASAISVFQPREIAMVLDFSGSMAFDSQFRNIGLLGQTAIETNLKQIYGELGSPKYGTLTLAPVKYGDSSTSSSKVLKNFKLDVVAYPFPGGSWADYVSYVQTDSQVNSAGYRSSYGYLTWVNYLQARQGSHSATPKLCDVSEQPVTALKDAVDAFLAYLEDHDTDDRVALALYTAADGTGILEKGLTEDYSAVSAVCRARQAGHYVGGTNISAGMKKGREELESNARVGTYRMMLLMTDGVVNLPSGNTTSDKAAVITQANLCAAAKIPVVTIALGAYADTALMQQVADITGGAAFIVAGGQPIAEVKEQLEEVFGQVAADRPLKLVE